MSPRSTQDTRGSVLRGGQLRDCFEHVALEGCLEVVAEGGREGRRERGEGREGGREGGRGKGKRGKGGGKGGGGGGGREWGKGGRKTMGKRVEVGKREGRWREVQGGREIKQTEMQNLCLE